MILQACLGLADVSGFWCIGWTIAGLPVVKIIVRCIGSDSAEAAPYPFRVCPAGLVFKAQFAAVHPVDVAA